MAIQSYRGFKIHTGDDRTKLPISGKLSTVQIIDSSGEHWGFAPSTGEAESSIAIYIDVYISPVRVLNAEQAKACNDAMCALNNVGARLHARIPTGDDERFCIHVYEYPQGGITVYVGDRIGNPCGGKSEQYADQNEFIAAYGLE